MDILRQLSVSNVGAYFSPNVQDFPKEDYDGLEFRYGRLTFRPAMWKFEGVLLSVIALYFAVSWIGSVWNSKKVHAWVKSHQKLYDAQFAKPGNAETLLADGPTDFVLFSTGRRAIAYLQTVFSLVPKHDIIQYAYELGWTIIDLEYSPQDQVTLDFKLFPNENVPSFVFGIVSKYQMKKLRKDRFDLTYFTKTTENSLVPTWSTVMSESGDITEAVLKSPAGTKLLAKLNDPVIAKYFGHLLITDQPDKRPTTGAIPAEKKERHVYLNLILPPANASAATEGLIQAVFDLIDFLDNKPPIRDDISRKLNKTRHELDALLTKEYKEPTAEEKEDAENARLAAKRKAEEEKFALLTPDQQRKYEEKERKKAQRKMQGRVAYK